MLCTMTVQVPQYTELLWPALQAVIQLGGSASIEELDNAVVEREGFSADVQGVLHGDGPSTEVEYRLAWARTYLKGMGLLTNSRRGVWSVTERGREVSQADIRPLHAEFSAQSRRKSAARRSVKETVQKSDEPDVTIAEAENETDWKDTLLETLLKMSPSAFERLAQRLLREAGSQALQSLGGVGMVELTG